MTTAADVRAADLQARTSLETLEWIRRALVRHDHDASSLLAEVLAALADAPAAVDVLTHDWTADWLATAVLLIDRSAPALLPDGQMAAHLASATNLLAALRVGDEPVWVRLDEYGRGCLPGTGLMVMASPAAAGLTVGIGAGPGRTSSAPRGRPALMQLPVVSDVVGAELIEEVELPAAAAPELPSGDPVEEAFDGSVDPEEPPKGVATRALIERWFDEGGAAADPVSVTNGRAPSHDLLRLLDRLGIPAECEQNTLSGDLIRQDASFDHLSLLSVRSPSDFAEVELCAAVGDDPITRRIRAHVAYIRRQYLDAAAIYATLIAAVPGDTDHWRDLCWALRHAGQEEVVRVWVLHPVEVVQVAEAVAWQVPALVPTSLRNHRGDASPLTLVIALLDWIANDLRTR